ncbi:hypothetical protein [Microbacterium paludicola]|uniref:hypothetical protein n=1 Tax=Microbacterium paludicola TaxID=300019 RepID=UPI0011A9DE1F|nr:hypothetical protein [Microbacterium paludicola]
MASIAVKPLVLKDVTLTVGTDNYEKHVSSVTFTPSSSTITWQGLNPDAKFTDVTSADWTVAIEFVQDWETEDSFSQYLFENEGETETMVFTPKKGTGNKTFTADVTITPGAIGGTVNAYATTSVTLGSTKPVIGTAA